MILLDSCAIFEILFAGPDAKALAKFLEDCQAVDPIALPPLVRLECSTVAAVRYKEGRFPSQQSFDEVLEAIDAFGVLTLDDDLNADISIAAARIKVAHAASMVNCYLIANAIARRGSILTADKEITGYLRNHAKIRKVGRLFSVISWQLL